MATLAVCLAEKARLMASPYRCVVKIHRTPQIAADIPDMDPVTTDDYLIWVKDGRTTATGAGGDTANESAGRAKTDPFIELRAGLSPRNYLPGQNSGNWALFDVGQTNWASAIFDSEVIFGA